MISYYCWNIFHMTQKHVSLSGSGIIYLGYSHFILCNLFRILVVWSPTQKQIFLIYFFSSKQTVINSQNLGIKASCLIRNYFNFLSWWYSFRQVTAINNSVLVLTVLSGCAAQAATEGSNSGRQGEIRGWLSGMPFFPTGLAGQVPGPPEGVSCFPETRAISLASATI